MENKLIGYLPIIGIFITIGLLLFNAIKNSNNQPTQPLDNVIKNINNTSASNNVDDSKKQETPNMEKNKIAKPNQVIDLKKSYTAVFKTSLGDMKIKLYTQEAPTTVNNFVYLAKNKFYDGLIFHRIIKGFMIQGGDPSGNGTGGPGYSFADENSKHKIVRGSLAMANAGPNTNGSQFFIVSAKETPWLDGKHTNFGEIIEGINVLDTIESVKTGPNDKPIQDVVINSIQIIEQ